MFLSFFIVYVPVGLHQELHGGKVSVWLVCLTCGMYELHARKVPIHVGTYIKIYLEYKMTISLVLREESPD